MRTGHECAQRQSHQHVLSATSGVTRTPYRTRCSFERKPSLALQRLKPLDQAGPSAASLAHHHPWSRSSPGRRSGQGPAQKDEARSLALPVSKRPKESHGGRAKSLRFSKLSLFLQGRYEVGSHSALIQEKAGHSVRNRS